MTTDKILDKLAKLKASRDGEAKIGNSAAAEALPPPSTVCSCSTS